MKEIRRGQVWFFKPMVERPGHIQQGARPVVILSHDDINKNSPLVLAAPCTTQGKKNFPTQVIFVIGEKLSVAMVHQSQPINISELDHLIMQIPDFIMEQFDKAIEFAFGVGMKSKIHESIQQSQKIPSKVKYTEPARNEKTESLEPQGQIEKSYKKFPKLCSSKESSDKSPESYDQNVVKREDATQRNKWTVLKMKTFIQEYEGSNATDKLKLLKKYGLSNVTVLSSYYHRFKKVLETS